MEFFNSLQQIKVNWQPYKKWETEQDDKEFQRQELHKRVPTSKEDLERASQYGRTLIDSINIMDQYSINKAEDVELASNAAMQVAETALAVVGLVMGGLLKKIPSVKNALEKSANKDIKGAIVLFMPMLAVEVIVTPLLNIKAKSYEKEASRIARYQAREDELKDPKNFVIYDKEQIEEAKEIVKTLPDSVEKEKKKKSTNFITNYNDSIKSIKILINDHESYLKWKEDHLKHEKNKMESFKNEEATPEQLQKAKKDQDNLLRTIRKVEINSQNYLSNTEMAFNIVLGSTMIAGAAGGGIVSGITWVLQKLKVISMASIFAQNMKKAAPLVGAFGLTIIAGSYAIKAQKKAAKIGRFKAKQELLNDPHNFITYSDEQLGSVKDLKAPQKPHKGFLGKFKDEVKFFFQLVKDYKDYETYQKMEGKDEQKLQKALEEIKISDEQIKDAKSLQKNAFMTFEKMDEMTQRYSDDTEAAADIGKQYINSAVGILGSLISFPLLAKNNFKIMQKSNVFTSLKLFLLIDLPSILQQIVQIPTEIKAVQIKKEAGRIGIMEAMQDLQDPRYFVNVNTEINKS